MRRILDRGVDSRVVCRAKPKRDRGYKLQATSYKLRATSYELQNTSLVVPVCTKYTYAHTHTREICSVYIMVVLVRVSCRVYRSLYTSFALCRL